MPKMKIFVVMCLLSFSLYNAGESVPQSSLSEPVNIIVILDTSDRLSKKPGQVDEDIKIATEIVTKFGKLVRHSFREIEMGEPVQYPHRLSFVVPYQPRVPPVPVDIIRQLELKDTGENYAGYERQEKALLAEIPKVYNFARQHQQTGSDIWDWFENEAHDYLCEGYQNLIICVSDGYLRFDRDIERPEGTSMHLIDDRIDMTQPLKPVTDGFSVFSVKFLMLEIDMKDNGDFANMEKYWNTWLHAIGIQDTDFARQERWSRKLQNFVPAE